VKVKNKLLQKIENGMFPFFCVNLKYNDANVFVWSSCKSVTAS